MSIRIALIALFLLSACGDPESAPSTTTTAEIDYPSGEPVTVFTTTTSTTVLEYDGGTR